MMVVVVLLLSWVLLYRDSPGKDQSRANGRLMKDTTPI